MDTARLDKDAGGSWITGSFLGTSTGFGTLVLDTDSAYHGWDGPDIFRANLAVEADSLITQLSKITVLGDTELRVFTEGTTVPAGAITLNNVENDFMGDLSASGQNMTLADANDLALRDFRVTGVLTIQTGGN